MKRNNIQIMLTWDFISIWLENDSKEFNDLICCINFKVNLSVNFDYKY